MNLFETLRQFKSVKPDSSFTEKSKRAILASPQHMPAMNPFRGILQVIETGAAVVLAGIFMLLVTGALSDAPAVTPVQYSVIDAAGLHAEAQAIDIQIKLANVSYPQAFVATQSPAFASAATNGALGASLKAVTSSVPTAGAAGAAAVGTSSTNEAAATSTSVDQVLQALTQ